MNKQATGTTFLFAAIGLIGPLARWAMWPPSKLEGATAAFMSDLFFLIWPTQALAVIEVNVGQIVAAVIAIVVNVLLFSILGVIAGTLIERRHAFFQFYLAVAILVVLLALWGAGFDLAYLNLFALVLGLLLYAVPFCLARCIYARATR